MCWISPFVSRVLYPLVTIDISVSQLSQQLQHLNSSRFSSRYKYSTLYVEGVKRCTDPSLDPRFRIFFLAPDLPSCLFSKGIFICKLWGCNTEYRVHVCVARLLYYCYVAIREIKISQITTADFISTQLSSHHQIGPIMKTEQKKVKKCQNWSCWCVDSKLALLPRRDCFFSYLWSINC